MALDMTLNILPVRERAAVSTYTQHISRLRVVEKILLRLVSPVVFVLFVILIKSSIESGFEISLRHMDCEREVKKKILI
jgi:hypothetical protein